MELHLTDEQASALLELLHHSLGELSSEVADTENPAFQRMLRERRQHLQEVEEQLTSRRQP